MYEVEIKVELTAAQREQLLTDFKTRGFASNTPTPQNDYYTEAHKSPYGAYDLKRYRNQAGTYIYTEKIWEILGGDPMRKENERFITKEEFNAALLEFPNALKIIKNREWFEGTHQDTNISLTIDSVKFDHSESARYFIEAEIDVKEKEGVAHAKEIIINFLKDLLCVEDITEAPGMFTLAFEKK